MEDKNSLLRLANIEMRENALLHVVQSVFNQIADMTGLPWAVRRVLLTGLRFSVMEAVYQDIGNEAVAEFIAGEVGEMLGNQSVDLWLRIQIVDFLASEVLASLYGSPGEAADD